MKKKLSVYFQGGLGNQLFQMSLAYLLAKKEKLKISFNTEGYSNGIRRFELNKFPQIKKLKIETKNTLNLKYKFIRFIKRKIIYLIQILNLEKSLFNTSNGQNKIFALDQKIFEISPYVYNEEIFNQKFKSNMTLVGYYQSEKYFSKNKKEILNLFNFPMSKNKKFIHFFNKIKNCNSVAVHVRRGDYISKELKQYFDILSKDYYARCFEYINKKTFNPKFFIFSDDIDYVKQMNMFKKNCIFVDTNSPFIDLNLMTYCKHFIIANSSFSWWGAWLCKNKKKIICAPSKWVNDNIPTIDIIPNEWIKINN